MTPFWLRWLREAPDRLDQVIHRVQDETRKVRADDRLTPQAKRDSLRELKLAADKEIAEIVAQAAEVEESAQRNIELGVRDSPSGDATERLLVEQQDTRAWQRAQRLLDAGTHPAELIARAGEAGDTATLRALRTELPAWLEASAVAGAEGGLQSVDGGRDGQTERRSAP